MERIGGLKYNARMKIDPKLYREALEHYRQWNEAELIERARVAGKRDSKESWREFNALWSFARRSGLKQSQIQQTLKWETLTRMQERIQKLETWRKTRGRAA